MLLLSSGMGQPRPRHLVRAFRHERVTNLETEMRVERNRPLQVGDKNHRDKLSRLHDHNKGIHRA